MSSSGELENATEFKLWLVENGAFVHPDVHFELVTFGFNVLAGNDVPPDSTIISIPFTLAITPDVSKTAFQYLLCGADCKIDRWTERQLECVYVCMHWIVGHAASTSQVLRHHPYIATLPSPDKLRTPLHFSATELDAFKGSNLYGATLDRHREWEAEWQQCRSTIASANPEWGHELTWERYLAASTYISSRAFPSTILSEDPSLITTPDSYPVLLPGIDALNHARAHPVSWVVSSQATNSQATNSPTIGSPHSTSQTELGPFISLVIHTATPRGTELLNNYGPKPNSELILGYGFSLPNNPDDTIVLKIGSASSSSSADRWEVGRDARGAEPVWEAILSAIRAQNRSDTGEEDEDEGRASSSLEDELCAADMLATMAQSLHDRLPPFPPIETRETELRLEVRAMLENYLEGQRAILQTLGTFSRQKEERAVQFAREQGIDILDDDEQGEED